MPSLNYAQKMSINRTEMEKDEFSLQANTPKNIGQKEDGIPERVDDSEAVLPPVTPGSIFHTAAFCVAHGDSEQEARNAGEISEGVLAKRERDGHWYNGVESRSLGGIPIEWGNRDDFV